MSKNRRVVVLQLVGLGVVVVLGPFRDKITSSQFHLSSVWGLALTSKHSKITAKKKSFFMVIFSFSLLLYETTLKVKVETRWELVPPQLYTPVHRRLPTRLGLCLVIFRALFFENGMSGLTKMCCQTRLNIFIPKFYLKIFRVKISCRHPKKSHKKSVLFFKALEL